jgi:hypothetical protein
MPPRRDKTPDGFSRPQDVTRRFLRIVRTFARVLYFRAFADVIGPEKNLNLHQQRLVGLFMLSLWHESEPLEPAELVKHRARSEPRKRKETEWMSPDGDTQHLCSFTALARGLNCALGLAGERVFTADDFRAVCVEFDAQQGQHLGVRGVDEVALAALLQRKQIPQESFAAAMFSNVLTPERFCELQTALAAVSDGQLSGGAAAKGKSKAPSKARVEEAEETPVEPSARRASSRGRAAAEPAAPHQPTTAPVATPLSRTLSNPQSRVQAVAEEAHELLRWVQELSTPGPRPLLSTAPSWDPPVPGAKPSPLTERLEGALLAQALPSYAAAYAAASEGISLTEALFGHPPDPCAAPSAAFRGLARAASVDAAQPAEAKAVRGRLEPLDRLLHLERQLWLSLQQPGVVPEALDGPAWMGELEGALGGEVAVGVCDYMQAHQGAQGGLTEAEVGELARLLGLTSLG